MQNDESALGNIFSEKNNLYVILSSFGFLVLIVFISFSSKLNWNPMVNREMSGDGSNECIWIIVLLVSTFES